MRKYKVPLGTQPGELAGGRPLAPGDVVSLSDEEEHDPYNKQLIKDGLLLPVPAKPNAKGGDA